LQEYYGGVRYLACLFVAVAAWAQGTDPRPRADDYEVHARVKGIEIGAEYMVSSFSGRGKTFMAPEHVVVEVALYAPKNEVVSASAAEFTLRVDGKVLRAVGPQMVVTAMQRQEWRQPKGVQATAGMGNDTVILGGPTRQLPPYGRTGPTPAPPRAPEPDYRGNVPGSQPVTAEELVVSTALPEGTFKGPVSGFVYFPYTGKVTRIRRVELIYGETSLKLK
jgi:hypothetical protein